jgi:hypothetical protein
MPESIEQINDLNLKPVYDKDNPVEPRWVSGEMPNDPAKISEELYRNLSNDNFLYNTMTRVKDLFGAGILKGGNISIGTNSGTVKIDETVAFDDNGYRIYIPATDNIPATAGTTVMVARYKFTTENSYEIIFRDPAGIQQGDEQLREITNNAGAITLGNDKRRYTKMFDLMRGSNTIIRDFEVQEGNTVNPGDLVSIDKNGKVAAGVDTRALGADLQVVAAAVDEEIGETRFLKLPSGKIVAFYSVYNTSTTKYSLRAVAIDSIDNNPVVGIPVTVVPEGASASAHVILDMIEVDVDKIVFAFTDADNTSYGRLIAGSISGSTITLGSAITFHSVALDAVGSSARMCLFGNILCIVSGNSTASTGQALTASIDVLVITLNAPIAIANNANSFKNVVLVAFTPNKAVLIRNDNFDTRFQILSYSSGLSMSAISTLRFMVFAPGAWTQIVPSFFFRGVRISDSKILLILDYNSYLWGFVLDVGADAASTTFGTLLTQGGSLAPTYPILTNEDGLYVGLGDLSVNASPVNIAVFVENLTIKKSKVMSILLPWFETQRELSIWRNRFNAYALGIHTAEIRLFRVDYQHILGIAQTGNASNVKVTLAGLSNVHTGLAAGKHYSSDDFSFIGDTHQIGIAVSPTEIEVNIDRE